LADFYREDRAISGRGSSLFPDQEQSATPHHDDDYCGELM